MCDIYDEMRALNSPPWERVEIEIMALQGGGFSLSFRAFEGESGSELANVFYEGIDFVDIVALVEADLMRLNHKVDPQELPVGSKASAVVE